MQHPAYRPDAPAYIVIQRVGTFVLQSSRNWMNDNASTLGASLAFYCAFSLAPHSVILLSIAQLLLGATSANVEPGAQLTDLFGPATAKILLDAVTHSREVGGVLATVVSVVTLSISATTVLAALNAALQQTWKTPTV